MTDLAIAKRLLDRKKMAYNNPTPPHLAMQKRTSKTPPAPLTE